MGIVNGLGVTLTATSAASSRWSNGAPIIDGGGWSPVADPAEEQLHIITVVVFVTTTLLQLIRHVLGM